MTLLTISEETGKHELSTVADGVDSAVLDDEALVARKESLKRRDDLAKVRLVPGVVHLPLGVENVVQGNEALGLVHGTASDSAKLLHVAADSEEETQVDAEGSNVGAGLAADPEDTEVTVIVELNELAFMDGSDTELALDGGDQGRTLEERTGEGFERASELGLAAGQLVVKADDGDVFLSSTLLRLNETGGAVDANNQASGDLGIEGAAVASLFASAEKKVSQ